MKKSFIIIFTTMSSLFVNAQMASLELVYSETSMVEGYTTCRLYANLSDVNASVHAVFGDEKSPINVAVNGDLYQNPFGGALASHVNPDLFQFEPVLAADSWFALGNENDASQLWEIGIDFEPFEQGQGFDANNGAWFLLPDDPACKPTENGKILLGQFTFNQSVAGIINLQGMDAYGKPWQQRGLVFSMISDASIAYEVVTEVEQNAEIIPFDSNETEFNLSTEEASFNIYPNPYNSGTLTIEFDEVPEGINLIECFDASGRLVYSQANALLQQQMRITDFPQLTPGIYLIRANNKAKQLVIN